MAALADGLYQIAFTDEQLLTGMETRPGAPLVMLPPGATPAQVWQVRSSGDGAYTISADDVYVSYDGDPDMHEMALLQLEPRAWRLNPGAEPGTFSIGVPDAPMRLGMSMLRIFPPRVALAPEYGDPYQAWSFKPVG